MAEKKAKTAQKTGDAQSKKTCPSCGSEGRVTLFTGFGRKGFFWVCDKTCGFVERTK